MIRLGYEVKTGRAVDIPIAHTAVTGQTQQSGKTTTLEALVHRSGRKAIAFITKRGEGSFRDATPIQPYFRDGANWEFVAAILEASQKEKLKFERSWIIDACKGAATLADVACNVKNSLDGVRTAAYQAWEDEPAPKGKKKRKSPPEWRIKPAGGLNRSVLTTLDAYLDNVVPMLAKLPYTNALTLRPGLNVMDLSDYTTEVQGLVIRSVLKWVYERETKVIVIIPEAWEFIPQNRSSPVLLAAEELIRKGAALENFLWIDSQDIAAVHKSVLRSVGVWILGVQREANEIKRMLHHIPNPTPSPSEIMMLKRGEFFTSFKDQIRKVYVQPFWIVNAHAEAVARGEIAIDTVEKIWTEKNKGRKKSQGDPLDERILTAIELPEKPGAIQVSPAAETPATNSVQHPAGAGVECESGSGKEKNAQRDPAHAAGGDEAMWKERFEQSEAENKKLRDELEQLKAIVAGTAPILKLGATVYDEKLPEPASRHLTLNNPLDAAFMSKENTAELVAWLQSHPVLIELLREIPTVKVTTRRPVLALDGSTLIGKIGVLIAEGFFNTPKQHREVYDSLKKRWGVPGQVAHVYPPLKNLNQDAVLLFEGNAFQIAPGIRIEKVEA